MNVLMAQRMVAQGMWFLDRTRPGWENLLSLPRLDTRSSTDCVLGQLYGSFAVGVAATRVPPSVHGFHLPPSLESADNHALLSAAWREAVALRRARALADAPGCVTLVA